MSFQPDEKRYDTMRYRRCGRSGLLLPAVSLGLWQGFGGGDDVPGMKRMLFRAFDLGITHFDLANGYGSPPPGAAEANLGKVLESDLAAHRDELVISTKAGYGMWPGPYGDWGSRKYLLASLDQSLRRLKLDYVDIYYHHRPDPETPPEETAGALASAVKQGKALYVGISSYSARETAVMAKILREMGMPCLIHQASYSMLKRRIEKDLFVVLEEEGMGCIAFSPLSQGLLTDRYLHGIPGDSRAANPSGTLDKSRVTEELLERVRALKALAEKRGQTTAQIAIAWILRLPIMTSVLVGASKVRQLEENAAAAQSLDFSADELAELDRLFPAS